MLQVVAHLSLEIASWKTAHELAFMFSSNHAHSNTSWTWNPTHDSNHTIHNIKELIKFGIHIGNQWLTAKVCIDSYI
jgi:hypothetical protein